MVHVILVADTKFPKHVHFTKRVTQHTWWVQGVDHVILVAAAGKKLILRQYAVRLLKSGGRRARIWIALCVQILPLPPTPPKT
jgi:hypothetical protein